MISETARIVAVDGDALWIEARRASRCEGCGARGACGQRLLDGLHGADRPLRLPSADSALLRQASAGDLVSVGIPESLILRLSLAFYLLPLAGLLGGALVAALAGGGEAAAIAAGLAGLAIAFGLLRSLGRRAGEWRPVLLALHSSLPTEDSEKEKWSTQ